MSGLAGILRLDGAPADEGLVRHMLDFQGHRGPDGLFVRTEGPVSIGYCAHHTTPEAAKEIQPMATADGQLILSADARLDNRSELQEALRARDLALTTGTDAELILRSYEAWECDAARHLLGDFAFVLWDRRKHRLFCAVDPCGVRPLFYSADGRAFRWASEIKTLLLDPAAPRGLNQAMIAEALLIRPREREETLCRGILRLPPARDLVLEAGRTRTRRYWDIDPELAIRHADPRTYVEQFRDLLERAVGARLRSNGPAGVWLSGGLDSSSVACTARDLMDQGAVTPVSLEAFSIHRPGSAGDETAYIEDTVSRCRMPARLFDYDRTDSRPTTSRGPDLLGFAVGFILDPILERARQGGVHVMLDGNGGDERFGGASDLLSDWASRGRWGRVRRELHACRRGGVALPLAQILRACMLPHLPDPLVRAARRGRRPELWRFRPDWVDPRWLDPQSRKPERLEGGGADRARTRFLERKYFGTLIHGTNTNHHLPHWCQAHADAGIETRHPFYDRRIVEFLFAVPLEVHWQEGWSKWLLREATQGILPESVRQRRDKSVADETLRHELRTRQMQRLTALLTDSVLVEEGIVRINPLRKSIELLRMSALGASECLALARLLKMEAWLRHLDEMPVHREEETNVGPSREVDEARRKSPQPEEAIFQTRASSLRSGPGSDPRIGGSR